MSLLLPLVKLCLAHGTSAWCGCGVGGTTDTGSSTARIWHGEVATTELKGHTQNLLAVLALGDNEVITASGDRMIKRWRDGKQISTIATLSGAHPDLLLSLLCVLTLP